MKFVVPHPVVTSEEDATENFQFMQSFGLLVGSQNLSDLTTPITALTNLGMARGIATLTFSASNLSGLLTVSHGMLLQPIAVVATSVAAPTAGEVPICNTLAYSPTTFQVNGQTTASWTGSVQIAWVAVS